MKPIFRLTALAMTAAMLFSFLAFSSESAYGLAYNIYSNPVFPDSKTPLLTTYMIDFYSDETPFYTFWALANFGLYKSRETKVKYKGITGGGGYAGLQDGARSENPDGSYLRDENGNLVIGKIGIMSFWEMDYLLNREHVKMTASALYPHGDSAFGGEGEGSHVMWPYEWDDAAWYTMLLHTWQDAETGTTFMGQWFRNVSTGEWTLHSYFDTHLINSCMEGGMGLFLENYSSATRTELRSFRTKNLYAQDFRTGAWTSLDTCKISYGDGGTANKYGRHEFGATDEYFWGRSGGEVEDQAAYEASSVKEKTFKITQPSSPDFGSLPAPSMKVESVDNTLTVTWTEKNTDAPQLSYEIRIVDKNGRTVASCAQTRPEIRKAEIARCSGRGCTCVLTVTDVFGRTSEVSAKIDAGEVTGDVNDDGVLSIFDVTCLLYGLDRGAALPPLADVNKDGKTDDKDIEALLARLAS